MSRSNEKLVARALSAEHGITYQAALNLTRRELARLRLEGVPLKESLEQVAIMTREQLGLREGQFVAAPRELRKRERFA